MYFLFRSFTYQVINQYLILQLLDLSPEWLNSAFVTGVRHICMGRISSWKDRFSFWILIEAYHLCMCCMCTWQEFFDKPGYKARVWVNHCKIKEHVFANTSFSEAQCSLGYYHYCCNTIISGPYRMYCRCNYASCPPVYAQHTILTLTIDIIHFFHHLPC